MRSSHRFLFVSLLFLALPILALADEAVRDHDIVAEEIMPALRDVDLLAVNSGVVPSIILGTNSSPASSHSLLIGLR